LQIVLHFKMRNKATNSNYPRRQRSEEVGEK